MQFEAYRDLIKRLEVEAARDPRGYALRVGLFGVLGYAYILGVFAVITAVALYGPQFTHGAGARLLIHLALLLLPIAVLLLRVLIVRVPAPRGVVLVRARVPALFAMIDEMAAALDAPRPDHVLLTADYNCSALQRPWLGIFGWPENTLMIGLPMFETLSRARFRAILAHELAHLSAHHSTFAGRMHVVSEIWRQMLNQLTARRGAILYAFAPFFRWYGPRFQAMGFVLGRRQEYFADECARRVAGERSTRGALVRIETMARYHRDVMETTLHPRPRDSALPPADAVTVMARRMREDPAAEQIEKWLDEALRAETGYEHTHPAFRDRLEALNPRVAPVPGDALAEPGASAAQELLGNALDSLACEVSAAWVSEVAAAWKARHEELAQAARTASEPLASGDDGAPASDAVWRTLAARLEVEAEQGAVEPLKAFLADHPDHAVAHYRLGRVLLRERDDSGLRHFDHAMELDSDATPVCCGLAIDYLRAHGRGREAETYTRKAWEYSELIRNDGEERGFLRRKDRLVPSGLPTAILSRLCQRIAQEDWITAAYLVRKEVALRPEKPCYVLGIRVRRTWYKLVDAKKEAHVRHVFLNDVAIPEGTWMFVLEGDLRWARGRIARIERALIWSRPKRAATSSESAQAA